MSKPFIPFRDLDKERAAEYAQNMKAVAAQTKEINEKEITAIEQQLSVLKQEPFEFMKLPILAHTFIILDAPHRFELLPMYIKLLQYLQLRIERTGGDTKVITEVLATTEEVREFDTSDNYPTHAPFDTSQFLTQYHVTRMANGMTDNHREKKLQEKIRQHIIKSYQQTLACKQRAVANCETVLSKKLYGES